MPVVVGTSFVFSTEAQLNLHHSLVQLHHFFCSSEPGQDYFIYKDNRLFKSLRPNLFDTNASAKIRNRQILYW